MMRDSAVTDRLGDRRRLLVCAGDEDMHEVAVGACGIVADAEQADLVAHRGGAETADAQPCLHQLRVGDGAVEPAERFQA